MATLAHFSSPRTDPSISASHKTSYLALGVIVDTSQTKRFQAIDRALVLDEPATGAHTNEITALRHGPHFPCQSLLFNQE
jgi:hypothetical protein